MSRSSTSESTIYQVFQKIGITAFPSIIRFFEDNEGQVKSLSFPEYFEILVAYSEALFETGSYEKHLEVANLAVEFSVMNNIKIHKGYNIFQQLLFRKSASHYYMMEYAQSEHILRELIKICPSEEIYSRFLIKVLRKRIPSHVHHTRALSVLLFIISAIVICIEILVVRNFWPEYTNIIHWTRNGIFFLGWIILLSGDGVNYLSMHREVKQFKKKMRSEKLRKLRRRHATEVPLEK